MHQRKPTRTRRKINYFVNTLFKRTSASKPQKKKTSADNVIGKHETSFEKELHLEVHVENIQNIDGCADSSSIANYDISSADAGASAAALNIVTSSLSDHSPSAADEFLFETSASDDITTSNSYANEYDEKRNQTTDTDTNVNDSGITNILYVDKENEALAATQKTTNLNSQKESFGVGDNVQVISTHKKHAGMKGRVFKMTKQFVFFTKDDTTETVQVSPKFLVLNNNRPVLISSTPEKSEAKDFSAEFKEGEMVLVSEQHAKHRGKKGVVEKVTAKFASIKVDGTNERFRIMKSSLVHDALSSVEDQMVEQSDEVLSQSEVLKPAQKMRATVDRLASKSQKAPGHRSNKASSQTFVTIPQRLERVIYGTSHAKEKCLLREMLSDDVQIREYELSKTSDLPPLDLVMHHQGKRYELYYGDVESRSDGIRCQKTRKVVAHYVQTEDLRELEESLADFGSLEPRKVWARRKLFLSTAAKLKDGYAVKEIFDADVFMNEDAGYTEGCGFICEKYLMEILGSGAAARRALGVQVRINIPTCGVFKGVLMRKCIVDGPPIQLNESLRKVLPSRDTGASSAGRMIMNRVFPSNTNVQVARLFPSYDGKHITNTFIKEVQAGRECKLSDMYKQLMRGLGAPKELLDVYAAAVKRDASKLCHTHLVGVADPTGRLPPNTVFMTGIKPGDIQVEKLFVSRSPALEPEDGRMIRVVTTKPDIMSKTDWDWLQTLHFGALIFANPKIGQTPLPELIADGDLDGDLYFVCWDRDLLSHIDALPVTEKDLELYEAAASVSCYSHDWFDKAQEFVANASNIVDVAQLTGILYKLSENIAKKSEDSIKDDNAVAYAKAYKHCLEYKKHGKKLVLPAHLLDDVPTRFHCMFAVV